MIYLDFNSIYNKQFRGGLLINGLHYMYYSFLFKKIVFKTFYTYSGLQRLRCLPVK